MCSCVCVCACVCVCVRACVCVCVRVCTSERERKRENASMASPRPKTIRAENFPPRQKFSHNQKSEMISFGAEILTAYEIIFGQFKE